MLNLNSNILWWTVALATSSIAPVRLPVISRLPTSAFAWVVRVLASRIPRWFSAIAWVLSPRHSKIAIIFESVLCPARVAFSSLIPALVRPVRPPCSIIYIRSRSRAISTTRVWSILIKARRTTSWRFSRFPFSRIPSTAGTSTTVTISGITLFRLTGVLPILSTTTSFRALFRVFSTLGFQRLKKFLNLVEWALNVPVTRLC